MALPNYWWKRGRAKELIISQLKREIYDLRTNERDFNELHTQLSNLEHRYSLLHDEKVKSDQEYKARTEAHLKQIANLKQTSYAFSLHSENFNRQLSKP